MAEKKTIRFYKFIAPPKDEGAKISIGGKQVSGSSFSTTIKAINSLGITVNSIGVAVQAARAQQTAQMQEISRRNQLEIDRANARKMKKGNKMGIGLAVGALMAKAAPTFFGWLGKLFTGLMTFAALKWLGDKENQEKLTLAMKRIGGFFKAVWGLMSGIVSWIGKSWNQLFGADKSFLDRIEGAMKLITAGVVTALGLKILKNPALMVKGFTNMLSLVGKGIMNLGKFLGGNFLGQAGLGIAQGFMAYNDIMEDEGIDEEYRQSAAIGGSVGATTGAIGLGMIGNQIAGPIGGLIGNALGGFLGKNVGKFIGPMVKKIIDPIKKWFGMVADFTKKLLKPVGDAVKDFFIAYGDLMSRVLDMIEPHMPKILKAAEIIGKYAFGPAILLLNTLTKVLSWVAGSGNQDETEETSNTSTFNGTPANINGDPFKGEGGSTYPLKGSNFLGDFVASGSKYDDTGNGTDTSLIYQTVEELIQTYGEGAELGRYSIKLSDALAALKSMGKDPKTFKFSPAGQDTIFKELKNMAGYQDFLGEKIDASQFALNLSKFFDEIPSSEGSVNNQTRSWKDTLAMLESLKGGRSKGGIISGPQSGYPVGFNQTSFINRSNGGFVGHGTEFVLPIDTPDTRKDPNLTTQRLLQAVGIISKTTNASGILKNLLDVTTAGEQELDKMMQKQQVQTIVLDAIEKPVIEKDGGEGQLVTLPGDENPVTPYIQSRFGYLAESNTSPSNFL